MRRERPAPGEGVLAGVDAQRRVAFPRGIATRGHGGAPSLDLRRGDGALAPRRDGVPARGASAGVSQISSRGVVGPSEGLRGRRKGHGKDTARANALGRFSRFGAASVVGCPLRHAYLQERTMLCIYNTLLKAPMAED